MHQTTPLTSKSTGKTAASDKAARKLVTAGAEEGEGAESCCGGPVCAGRRGESSWVLATLLGPAKGVERGAVCGVWAFMLRPKLSRVCIVVCNSLALP